MRKITTALLAAIAMALAAGPVAAEKVKVGIEAAYPPFSAVSADGTFVGFDIDIANALCEAMGAECTLVQQDWDGIIPALLARKYDAIIASMSITEERKKKVAFTDKYYNTPAKFAQKKGAGTAIRRQGPVREDGRGAAGDHPRQLHHRSLRRQRRDQALHDPGRSLSGRGGRPAGPAARRFHCDGRRLPRDRSGEGLGVRGAGFHRGEVLRGGRRCRGAQGRHRSAREAQSGRSTRSCATASTRPSTTSTSTSTSTASLCRSSALLRTPPPPGGEVYRTPAPCSSRSMPCSGPPSAALSCWRAISTRSSSPASH